MNTLLLYIALLLIVMTFVNGYCHPFLLTALCFVTMYLIYYFILDDRRAALIVTFLTTSILLLISYMQQNAEPVLDVALRERVISVTKPGFWAATLQVTLFSPPGDGPFPVAVINHGKASGDPRWQARARYT